jgi:hypothetical protein
MKPSAWPILIFGLIYLCPAGTWGTERALEPSRLSVQSGARVVGAVGQPSETEATLSGHVHSFIYEESVRSTVGWALHGNAGNATSGAVGRHLRAGYFPATIREAVDTDCRLGLGTGVSFLGSVSEVNLETSHPTSENRGGLEFALIRNCQDPQRFLQVQTGLRLTPLDRASLGLDKQIGATIPEAFFLLNCVNREGLRLNGRISFDTPVEIVRSDLQSPSNSDSPQLGLVLIESQATVPIYEFSDNQCRVYIGAEAKIMVTSSEPVRTTYWQAGAHVGIGY